MDINQILQTTATNILNTSNSAKFSCLPCEIHTERHQANAETQTSTQNGIFSLYDLVTANQTSSSSSFTNMISSLSNRDYKLNASIDEKGQVNVKTEDGYKIIFEGKQEAWKIVSPDGTETRIWGDPHVEESDGDKWDFKEQSTFVFGNNKITVETTPYKNGETVTKSVTIYSGKDRLSIDNLDINKPNFVAWKLDGEQHNEALDDDDIYDLVNANNGSFSWQKKI